MHIIRICLFLCVLSSLQAQEMRVERVKVVDQSSPIFNIHVDENNKKWVSNTKGEVYLLHALDLADNTDKASGKQYLFDLPGGNADLSWSKSAMEALWEQEQKFYLLIMIPRKKICGLER